MSGWVLHSDPASAGCRPGPRRCAPVGPCSWQPTRAPPRGPAPVSAPRRRRVESLPRLEEAWSEHLGVFVVGTVLGTALGAGRRAPGRLCHAPEVSVPEPHKLAGMPRIRM